MLENPTDKIIFYSSEMAYNTLSTSIHFVGHNTHLVYVEEHTGGKVTYKLPYDSQFLPRMLLFNSPET